MYKYYSDYRGQYKSFALESFQKYICYKGIAISMTSVFKLYFLYIVNRADSWDYNSKNV